MMLLMTSPNFWIIIKVCCIQFISPWKMYVYLFLMKGPISYLPVWHPTEEEMETCLHLELSCGGDTSWNPSFFDEYNKQVNSLKIKYCNHNQTQDKILLPFLLDDIYCNIIIDSVRHATTNSNILSPEVL